MANTLVLTHGGHETRWEGTCLMEAVAQMAGENHKEIPRSVPLEISLLGIRINDANVWRDDADRTATLLPLIPAILNAAHGDGPQQHRANLAISMAVPLAVEVLKTRGFKTHKIKSLETCQAAYREAIGQQEPPDVGIDLGAYDPNPTPTLADISLDLDDAVSASRWHEIATLAVCAASAAANAAAIDANDTRSTLRAMLISLLVAFCKTEEE